MATWYLLNTIRFKGPSGPALLKAGTLIDDAVRSLTDIQNAGGCVAPSTYPTVKANAAICQTLLARGGAEGLEFTGEADRIMMSSFLVDQQGIDQNRVSSSGAAGATVAAGAAICPNLTITPKYSGKVVVEVDASFAALGAGVVTPLVKQATTTIIALAASSGTGGPLNYHMKLEITGLTLGTAVTFSFVTTGTDATVTLGAGATGKAANFRVAEVM
jgi:hypothetical protein